MEKIKKIFTIHLNKLRNSFSPFAELVVHSQLARLHILKNIFLLGSGIPRYNQAVQQRSSHLQPCPTVLVPSSHNHFSLCSYPGQAHHRAALDQSVLLPLLLLHLLHQLHELLPGTSGILNYLPSPDQVCITLLLDLEKQKASQDWMQQGFLETMVEVVVESGMMVTRVEAEGGSVLMADMLTGC